MSRPDVAYRLTAMSRKNARMHLLLSISRLATRNVHNVGLRGAAQNATEGRRYQRIAASY